MRLEPVLTSVNKKMNMLLKFLALGVSVYLVAPSKHYLGCGRICFCIYSLDSMACSAYVHCPYRFLGGPSLKMTANKERSARDKCRLWHWGTLQIRGRRIWIWEAKYSLDASLLIDAGLHRIFGPLKSAHIKKHGMTLALILWDALVLLRPLLIVELSTEHKTSQVL